ncbi:MAG: hypothetical protein K6G81_07880 [Lachnospiraceae bacterium]|nr:hypothetical protein [Lachnospiraceae bacterium]
MTNTQQKAYEAIQRKEQYAAVELLQNENQNDAVTLSMLGHAYFGLGDFESAYDVFQKLYYDPNLVSDEFDLTQPEKADPLGNMVFQAMEQSQTLDLLSRVPKNPDMNYPQSNEDAEEDFPEFLEYQAFIDRMRRAGGGNPERIHQLLIAELKKMLETGDPAQEARVNYYKAESNLATGRYVEAALEYLEAASLESKALYYGFAGNMFFKFAMQNEQWEYLVPASVLTHRAIRIDPKCAKWYFNEAMILFMITKLLSPQEIFLSSAEFYAQKALSVLRPDQRRLRNTIEQWMEELRRNGAF